VVRESDPRVAYVVEDMQRSIDAQSLPTGNAEFQFHVAGFNFYSETYEWLVVNQAGTNAQFKGSGTVNGGLFFDPPPPQAARPAPAAMDPHARISDTRAK